VLVEGTFATDAKASGTMLAARTGDDPARHLVRSAIGFNACRGDTLGSSNAVRRARIPPKPRCLFLASTSRTCCAWPRSWSSASRHPVIMWWSPLLTGPSSPAVAGAAPAEVACCRREHSAAALAARPTARQEDFGNSSTSSGRRPLQGLVREEGARSSKSFRARRWTSPGLDVPGN
jgi:hypothetical protein